MTDQEEDAYEIAMLSRHAHEEIVDGKGYILLPDFFDPEPLLDGVSELVDEHMSKYGQMFSGGYRPDVLSDADVQALMLDPRLLAIAGSVLATRPAFGSLGCNSVPPGSLGMEPHFDYPYFAMPPESLPKSAFPALCVQMVWYLTDVEADGGPTTVVPRSQLRPESPSPEFYSRRKPVLAKAGTLFVGHGALWHGVSPNRTDKIRHALLGSYVPFYVHPMTVPMYGFGHTVEMQELMRSDFSRRIGEGYSATTASSAVQPTLVSEPVPEGEG